MKKLTALLLAFLLTLTLAACAGENVSSSEISSEPAATSEPTPTPDPTPTAAPTEEPVSEAEPDTGSKVLVAYFSATGNTRPLAEYMADGLGADLYEITPEEPYTDADLDYGDSNSRTSIEMNDPSARPAISGSVENMEQYDVVFIGYPIWWGQAPKITRLSARSWRAMSGTARLLCRSAPPAAALSAPAPRTWKALPPARIGSPGGVSAAAQARMNYWLGRIA